MTYTPRVPQRPVVPICMEKRVKHSHPVKPSGPRCLAALLWRAASLLVVAASATGGFSVSHPARAGILSMVNKGWVLVTDQTTFADVVAEHNMSGEEAAEVAARCAAWVQLDTRDGVDRLGGATIEMHEQNQKLLRKERYLAMQLRPGEDGGYVAESFDGPDASPLVLMYGIERIVAQPAVDAVAAYADMTPLIALGAGNLGYFQTFSAEVSRTEYADGHSSSRRLWMTRGKVVDITALLPEPVETYQVCLGQDTKQGLLGTVVRDTWIYFLPQGDDGLDLDRPGIRINVAYVPTDVEHGLATKTKTFTMVFMASRLSFDGNSSLPERSATADVEPGSPDDPLLMRVALPNDPVPWGMSVAPRVTYVRGLIAGDSDDLLSGAVGGQLDALLWQKQAEVGLRLKPGTAIGQIGYRLGGSRDTNHISVGALVGAAGGQADLGLYLTSLYPMGLQDGAPKEGWERGLETSILFRSTPLEVRYLLGRRFYVGSGIALTAGGEAGLVLSGDGVFSGAVSASLRLAQNRNR